MVKQRNSYFTNKPERHPQAEFRAGMGAICALLLFGLIQTATTEEVSSPAQDAPRSEVPVPAEVITSPLVPSADDISPGKVVIRGLASIEEEKARNMITFQIRNLEENGVTMARADDAAFFLQQELRNQGFDAATADWEITPDNSVVLTIDEGEILHFGDLTITGNDHLSDAAIRELLTKITRERLGYRTDAPKFPYVADDIESGVGGVEHFYTLLGYTEAEVELVSTERRSDSDLIDVALTVREGTIRLVGDIELPEAIHPSVELVYTEVKTEFAGKPFTEAVTANLIDRITTAANEAGYFDAELTVDPAKPRPGSSGENGEPQLFVDLTVNANWGDLYSLESVEVTGIEKIKEGVIDRKFRDLLGKPYSPATTGEVAEKLLQTGAFTALSMDPSPNPDGTISISVAVEEAKRKRLSVYGGFGTYEGAILGLEYRNSNYLGRLHTFEAALEYTSRGIRGDIEYTNPWIFNSDYEFRWNASSLNQQNEGYTVWDTGLGFGIRRTFGTKDEHRIIAFMKPGYGDITDFEIEERFLGPESYFINRAGLIYSFGVEEDRISSTQGFSGDIILSGASSAIGSEVEFGRVAVRALYVHPIGKSSLRLGARVGIIKPYGDEELPIDLRYFSGGPRSVRSFRERDLGPHDKNGYPVGGEFSTVFNVEYNIPIAGPFSIAPFFDAGNLLPDASDASFDDMHYAAGIGFVINSPIGPLRLDYGHNLNREENEPSGSWHVGFGFAF